MFQYFINFLKTAPYFACILLTAVMEQVIFVTTPLVDQLFFLKKIPKGSCNMPCSAQNAVQRSINICAQPLVRAVKFLSILVDPIHLYTLTLYGAAFHVS